MGAARYRKKPVTVEAWLFSPDPDLNEGLEEWLGDSAWYDDDSNQFVIETLEGTMRANVGDWIVKGVQGEFYPVKHDIFEATYEPVFDAIDDTLRENGPS